MTFKNYKLIDTLECIFSGGTPSTKNALFWEGNLNWLSSGETRNRLITLTEKKISKLATEKSSTRLAKKNDVVMASAGQGYTRGQTSLLLIDTYINQSIIAMRTNPKIIDYKYLYYNLSSRYKELRAISDSSSSRGSITTKMLKELDINLPEINVQKRISNVLWLLDSKISLNKQMIETLEEMASTLFKRWFVEFEFPDENGNPYKSSGGKIVESELGEIPEGWEINKLSKIIQKKNSKFDKKSDKEVYYTPIDQLPMKKLTFSNFKPKEEAKSSLIKYKKNDILIGAMRVYFHRVCFAPFDGITRTTTFVLSPTSEEYLYYSLLLVNSDSFISFASNTSKGSTMPYAVWDGTLENYKILIPTISILKQFNIHVANYLLYARELSIQNNELSKIRDTLLPKLLSGELEV